MNCDHCKKKIQSKTVIYKAFDYTFCSHMCKMEKTQDIPFDSPGLLHYKTCNIYDPRNYVKYSEIKEIKRTKSYAAISIRDYIDEKNSARLQNNDISLEYNEQHNINRSNICNRVSSFIKLTYTQYFTRKFSFILPYFLRMPSF
jgi:hypothetical protein